MFFFVVRGEDGMYNVCSRDGTQHLSMEKLQKTDNNKESEARASKGQSSS